jgi:hypothetical protein
VAGFSAILADVAVLTVGVRGGTPDGSVETVADIGFAPTGARGEVRSESAISPLPGGRFCSVWHEDGGVQAREGVVVGKEAGLSSLDHVTHGDVEHDDAGMRTREFGRENFVDVVAVCAEFLRAVGENKRGGFGGETPSRGPFRGGIDTPFRVSDAKADCLKR